MNDTLADVYGAMGVGYMIAEYIDEEDDWPGSWEELAAFRGEDATDAYFLDLKTRIEVDWDADIEAMASAESCEDAPFPVVRCISGAPAGPTFDHDANYVIYLVLQERARTPKPEREPIEEVPSE